MSPWAHVCNLHASTAAHCASASTVQRLRRRPKVPPVAAPFPTPLLSAPLSVHPHTAALRPRCLPSAVYISPSAPNLPVNACPDPASVFVC